MANIGTLTGEITLVDQMTAVLTKLDSVLKVTETGAKQVDDSIKHLDRTMSTATLAAQAFGNVLGQVIFQTLQQLPNIAFGAAREVEGAMATIARATGKTGAELDGLVTSFKRVNRDVPDSARNVSSAIAEIAKRTGATGVELEKLTKQLLAFANVNQVDVTEASKTVITMMNATEIPMSKLSSVMDKLTLSAQRSGLTVTELARGVIRGGVAFKQMGFDLDKSLALFTNFGKVGANTNDVVASVSRAMTKLAKAGVQDLSGGLQAIIDKIKEAKSFSDAVDLARDIFGAQGGQGVRLVEEIRGGTFDLGPMLAELQKVEGLTNRTEKATQTFDERIAVLTKRFKELTVPVGEFAIAMANRMIPHLETAAQTVLELGESFSGLKTLISGVPDEIKTLGVAAVSASIGVLALNTAIAAFSSLGIVKGLGSVVNLLAGASGSLVWAFRVVQSQIAIFGVTTGILSSRFLLLEKASLAVRAGFLAIVGSKAFLVTVITTIVVATAQLIEAFINLKKHLDDGKSALAFFTAKDDDNFVRKVLGWVGVLDELDAGMKTIQDTVMSVWQPIADAIEKVADNSIVRFTAAVGDLYQKIARWGIIAAGQAIWDTLSGAITKAFDAYQTLVGVIPMVWDWTKKLWDLFTNPKGLTTTNAGVVDLTTNLQVGLVMAFDIVASEFHKKFDPIIKVLELLNKLLPDPTEMPGPQVGAPPPPQFNRDQWPRFGPPAEIDLFEPSTIPPITPRGWVPTRPTSEMIAPEGGTDISALLEDDEATKEYEKSVQSLVATLSQGDKSLKVFTDAFKRLKPAQLEVFEVQERIAPQIMKMVEANQKLTPKMQAVLEQYQKTRAVRLEDDIALLNSMKGVELNIMAMEKMKMSQAEIAHALGVSVDALEEYRERLNIAAAESEASREREIAAWRRWADQVQDSSLRAMNAAADQAKTLEDITKKKTALIRSMTMDATEAQILAVRESTQEQIDELDRQGKLVGEVGAKIKKTLLEIRDIEIGDLKLQGAIQKLGQFNQSIGNTKVLLERMIQAGRASLGTLADPLVAMVAKFDVTGQIGKLLKEMEKGILDVDAAAKQAAFDGLTKFFDLLGQVSGPAGMGKFMSAIGGMVAGLQLANQTTAQASANAGRAVGGSFGVLSVALDSNAKKADRMAASFSAATSVVQGMANVWESTGKAATKGGRALEGAMAGLQAGAAFGPWGAAIGAAAGALIGLFRGKPKWVDEAERAMKRFGVEISDELAKSIAEQAEKRFKGDLLTAETFNLDKIIAEGGGLSSKNIDQMTDRLRDVFVLVGKGSLTAAEGVEVLDKNFTEFLKHSTDDMGNWSQSIKEIIRLADDFGLESEAMKQAQREQAIIVTQSFNAIVDGSQQALKSYEAIKKRVDEASEAVKKGTGTQEELTRALEDQFKAAQGASQELKDLGTIAVASFAIAMEHGATFLEALMSVQGGLKQLREAYQNLGMNADDPFLQLLMIQEEVLTNNPALIKGISGLSSQLVAMNNLNMLNAESFASLGRLAFNAYTRLQAEVAKAGGTTKDALLPMQQFLQEAAAKARELGIPLDDNTQMLINQSKELGIWKEAGLSANEKIFQSTEKLTAAIDKLTNALLGIPTSLPNPFADWEMPDIHPPDLPQIEEDANNAAEAVDTLGYGASPGGLVDIPMLLDRSARASQEFAAIAIPSLRNVFDIVEDSTALENQTQQIFKLADSTKFIPDAPFGKWETDRHAGEIHHMSGQMSEMGPIIRELNTDPWAEWKTVEQSTEIQTISGHIAELDPRVETLKPNPWNDWTTTEQSSAIHQMSGQALELSPRVDVLKPDPWVEWKTLDQVASVQLLNDGPGGLVDIPVRFDDATTASQRFADIAQTGLQRVISTVEMLNQKLLETQRRFANIAVPPPTAPITAPEEPRTGAGIIYRPPPIGAPGGGGSIGYGATIAAPMDLGDTRVRERTRFGPADGEEEMPAQKVIHHHEYFFLGVREVFEIEQALDELTARLPEEARANARNHFGTRMRAALEID